MFIILSPLPPNFLVLTDTILFVEHDEPHDRPNHDEDSYNPKDGVDDVTHGVIDLGYKDII